MTLAPNEAQQELNRQYDIYAAAREEYRKKIAEQADEIERLRAALNADDQTLRLHLGEMTSQEMRTLKAGLKWVLSCAALEGKQ